MVKKNFSNLHFHILDFKSSHVNSILAGESVLGRLSSVNGFVLLSVNFNRVKMFVLFALDLNFVSQQVALKLFVLDFQ